MQMLDYDITALFRRPIAAGLIIASAITLVLNIILAIRAPQLASADVN